MLATGYLPRRWPSKYCRRYESLRLCSGWEQVVYSCLVTSEFFEYAQNCIKYKLTYHQLTLDFALQNLFRKSPRPISNARLKMLPLLHLHPINVVIYNGTY